MGKDTVQQFFEKLITHTKDLNIADDQLVVLFVGGLVPAIQKHVLTKEPTDLRGLTPSQTTGINRNS